MCMKWQEKRDLFSARDCLIDVIFWAGLTIFNILSTQEYAYKASKTVIPYVKGQYI